MENLSKEYYKKIDLSMFINTDEIKENYEYSRIFYNQSKEEMEKGNETASSILKLFGDVTSYHLNLDSDDTTFQPFMVMDGKRTASIEDLTESELSFLEEVVEEITVPEIKSRILDVLWVRNRNFKMAIKAIENYIKVYEQVDNWYTGKLRLERAVELAGLFRRGQIREEIINKIEEEISKHREDKESFTLYHLIELLLKLKRTELVTYIELLKEIALFNEENNNWDRAREYWNLCIKCLTYEKKFTERDEIKLFSVNTYVKEAEKCLEDNRGYFVASLHMQNAVEAYRRIEGTTERVKNLNIKLLDYQRKALGEMKPIESEGIDITNIVENSIEKVKGKPFDHKLITLTLLSHGVNVNELRKSAEESINKYPLKNIFTSTKVNSEGKVVSKTPSTLTKDPEEQEESIKIEMYDFAGYHRQVTVEAIIEPIRKEILKEHFIMLRDFYPLVVNNSFIPEDREEIFAKGLYYGLNGDFLISTHILIPQLENSIRYLLNKEGEIVTNLDSEGIQEEKNLNTLLYIPKLEELLGKDLVFDLQSLLVEKHGSNLRNNMSHGLLSNDEFSSIETIYLWWLILKLCISHKVS